MIKLSDGNQYDQLGQAEQLLRETAAMSIYYMPNRINNSFFFFFGQCIRLNLEPPRFGDLPRKPFKPPHH